VSIVGKQLEFLERQIDQSTKLHNRLHQLQDQLTRGEEPALADWLTTLEMMTMYDKYFSADELKHLRCLLTLARNLPPPSGHKTPG